MEKKNNVEYRLMNETDNKAVLDLISSTSIQGNIEISFSKEPDYLKAMRVCALEVQALIGRVNQRIEMLGTRTLKLAYINGKEEILGYLSDLKISKNARKIHALSNGYKVMKSIMDDRRAKVHITTIIDDNKAGKFALTWANKHPNIPNYFDLGIMNTYFIFPIFPKFNFNKINIIRGSRENLEEIVKFLNEEGKKKQFFPVCTVESFLNLENFNIEDFYIAIREDKIVGIIAKWEQTPFKQVIIKKYNGKWKWIKKITGKFLPDENKPIKQFYLSFVVIKDNDRMVFEKLLTRIYNDNREYKYFSLILHDSDPLNRSLKKYFNVKYRSRLYIAEYLEDKEIRELIDNRIPYAELGLL